MPTDPVAAAITTVVERCLAVRPGEHVVVVTDPPKRAIGEALRNRASAAGADAVLCVMDERAIDGTEPPPPVAAALAAADVFMAPTTRSLSHTAARRAASERGARGATLPNVTEDILARLLGGDLDALQRRSQAVAELLTSEAMAHVTCPRGSDLILELGGRTGISDDGDLTAPGAFGNLPCGEAFVAPTGGRGTVVASSLASIGLADPPAVLTIEDGTLIAATGPAGEELHRRLDAHGRDGRHVAELGVGTNERARLGGNVLEDEKILGTVHVAFGASKAIGGKVSVPVHLDVVVLEATLTIGPVHVLEGGRFVLDVA